MNFIFTNLCCVESNKEQSIFERGSQKIILELDISKSIEPLKEYNFEFIPNEEGKYEVTSFKKDKFGIVEFDLESYEGRISIFSHIDSFKQDDMKYFSHGQKFKFEIN